MTTFTILVLGFLIGMKHATEADHLAAVATLVTRQTTYAQTMLQGVAWGLGHTITLMLFGGIVLALDKAAPPRLEPGLEFCVGLMLIALGADVLRRVIRRRIHFHVHAHGREVTHVHAHSHAATEVDRAAASPIRHADTVHEHLHGLALRALAVGTMHGLAGSAALVLLSFEAVENWTTGLVYIAFFGAGSIAGMALLSVAIAVPLRLSAGRLERLHGATTVFLGGCSCALGIHPVYQIGFAQGLLIR
jgi:hypothetical protein